MRKMIVALALLVLIFLCTGCTTSVSMPYSSDDYKELDWSVEELIDHFKDLGFSNIKTDIRETFDESQARICRVAMEDTAADSWFTEYKDFEKDDEFGTHLEVYISAYTLIPTLTVDNCAEFAELVNMDRNLPEKADRLSAFMEAHNGEYIEFDGLLTEWNDKWWYVGIDFTIAVEESSEMSFSWNNVATIDLGMTGDYHYEKYKTGLITSGMRVHMLAKIKNTRDGWDLEIDSMQIIEES